MNTPKETSPAPPTVVRKSVDPTRLFLQRDRLPWIWFGLAVAVAVLAAAERFHLVAEIKRPQSVVIIDPSRTYYVSPTLAFQDAKELHAEQATLATLSLLTRNPKDFDHPELLKKVLLPGAHGQAVDQLRKETSEFRSKQLHQKAEIGEINILATRDSEVLVHVKGQLIRTGVFQEKAFNEALRFSLQLRLVRNPNMALNGRFPTAVAEFKYETAPLN
jgi:hypothetical protein